jgi:hypothetical protein
MTREEAERIVNHCPHVVEAACVDCLMTGVSLLTVEWHAALSEHEREKDRLMQSLAEAKHQIESLTEAQRQIDAIEEEVASKREGKASSRRRERKET